MSNFSLHRRKVLRGLGGLGWAGVPGMALLHASRALAAPVQHAGAPQPFDYAWLKGQARARAAVPYHPPEETLPASLKHLDWDQYQAIGFRSDHALWAGKHLPFEIGFFHLGLNFKTPVRMYEVAGGQARRIAFDPAMFDYGKSGVDGSQLPPQLDFAGFRVFSQTDLKRDIAAFLGASYFRAVGGDKQYGISARGLAIDSGMDRPEEFPSFLSFWFERPTPASPSLTIYALLDSPSAAGAYRFVIAPDATLVMDVDAAIYPRRTIARIGIAPLTSMYMYGENDRRMAVDWRPEIHDSDGLAMWTGAGEWIWRPLVNPAGVRFNAYQDHNPRGFGLLQRDRNFDHYQDDGVFYNLRPSLWVEPRGDWGQGSVQLVELPTGDETNDNIVAFWNPREVPQPGQELLYAYRLYWGSVMPFQPPLARVVATRTGVGGVVGQEHTYVSWRFVVDFAGGDLARLGRNVVVEPVITASRGTIELTSARPLAAIQGYRAMFDLKPVDASNAPYNLRLYLRGGSRTLSETWLYQWTPPERRPY